jgi:hypothetical protein
MTTERAERVCEGGYFVVQRENGRWFTGDDWSDDPADALPFWGGRDPWRRAHETARRLSTARGPRARVAYIPLGSRITSRMPPA